MWTYSTRVTCPSCYQSFDVVAPAASEVPAAWDYDCEVCCHPMVIHWLADEEGTVYGEAHSLVDS